MRNALDKAHRRIEKALPATTRELVISEEEHREIIIGYLVAVLKEAYKREDSESDLVVEYTLNELEQRMPEQKFVELCDSLE